MKFVVRHRPVAAGLRNVDVPSSGKNLWVGVAPCAYAAGDVAHLDS
ncbi:hypothetical protein DB959_24620 [Salmonella enterica]|nr:hypothetical protein [Salmonella enterica]